jgi:hypothetical protein
VGSLRRLLRRADRGLQQTTLEQTEAAQQRRRSVVVSKKNLPHPINNTGSLKF